MQDVKIIEHADGLGQPIRIGDRVAFTWGRCRSVFVGQIIKSTAKRVRIRYVGSYTFQDGRRETYVGYRVAQPDDCVILGEGLQSVLTMQALKNQL